MLSSNVVYMADYICCVILFSINIDVYIYIYTYNTNQTRKKNRNYSRRNFYKYIIFILVNLKRFKYVFFGGIFFFTRSILCTVNDQQQQ
jgi:hypothetical protein